MEKVLLCQSCIFALRSRGEKVFVGDRVERLDYEEDGKEFKCGFCGDDFLYDDDPQDDDELYECVL